MTVRFFPGKQRHKTSLIAGFLSQFRVEHELVRTEGNKLNKLSETNTHHFGDDPAVEVDGRLFVDPNVDALKKILNVESATQS
ncbi:MAG TPA: hypothetical protein VF618_15305 [Thermoanaerobaculia bacterium]